MENQWFTTMKPSFQTEWLAISVKESHQVLEKIALLAQDPRPDGATKKKLKYLHGKLHCIRSGDYRIFYTFEKPYISLIALRRRNDGTYEEDYDTELVGGYSPQVGAETAPVQMDWQRLLNPSIYEKKRFPKPMTRTLLEDLHVPETYCVRLLSLQTQEDLLDCPEVPDEILLKIDEYLFEKPLAIVIQQPDYVVPELDDLQRLKDGNILGFLLRLSPEQEAATRWALDASGPTQVKGKPGTGKSTVALYRVRSLLDKLRETGHHNPRILFTTYTNALVETSKQLLGQLLGNDVSCVHVCTADKLVMSLVEKKTKIVAPSTLSWFIKVAIERAIPEEHKRLQFLNKLSYEYLLEEITQVIIARNTNTMEQYINANRAGRRVRLVNLDRQTIWRIHTQVLGQLEHIGQETWEQVRVRAETNFSKRPDQMLYDSVVVDEAQDLDPSVLRILVRLCKSPNRFFITADANQSIYGSGFTWKDVDESLKFQGRTTTLKTNYRSTRQIGEAAQSYLATGALESEFVEWTHITNGQKPAIRTTQNDEDEVRLLINFLSNATKSFRVGLRECAVFCPTKQRCEMLVEQLNKQGILANFMSRQDVNISLPGVKVLTLHSSKGLEFPVVALASFRESRFDREWNDVSEGEREEQLSRSRRLLFVGMTRAMRTLLLLVPASTKSPLLTDFDTTIWDSEASNGALELLSVPATADAV